MATAVKITAFRGYDAVQAGINKPTFRRNIQPSFYSLIFLHDGGKFLPDSMIALSLNWSSFWVHYHFSLVDNEPVSLSVYLTSPETSTSHGGVIEGGKVEAQAGKQRFQGEVN
jgi:hypothetical protein